MISFACKTQILFVFACLVVSSYGYFPIRSNGLSGLRNFGIPSLFPSSAGRRIGGNIVISIACDDKVPYQDQCQRSCHCTSNQLVCPSEPCDAPIINSRPNMNNANINNANMNNINLNNANMNICPNMGPFQKDCNTCVCYDMGTVCTANQCE